MIPSRFDALFYAGLGIFILGIFVYVANTIIGLIIFIGTPFLESYAIIGERKHRMKAVSLTVGNIFAIIWIIVQILVSVFLIMLFGVHV